MRLVPYAGTERPPLRPMRGAAEQALAGKLFASRAGVME